MHSGRLQSHHNNNLAIEREMLLGHGAQHGKILLTGGGCS